MVSDVVAFGPATQMCGPRLIMQQRQDSTWKVQIQATEPENQPEPEQQCAPPEPENQPEHQSDSSTTIMPITSLKVVPTNPTSSKKGKSSSKCGGTSSKSGASSIIAPHMLSPIPKVSVAKSRRVTKAEISTSSPYKETLNKVSKPKTCERKPLAAKTGNSQQVSVAKATRETKSQTATTSGAKRKKSQKPKQPTKKQCKSKDNAVEEAWYCLICDEDRKETMITCVKLVPSM